MAKVGIPLQQYQTLTRLVVEVGESGARIAMDVKAGDKILFGKWAGTEIKIDGEELMIMKESDILGILA